MNQLSLMRCLTLLLFVALPAAVRAQANGSGVATDIENHITPRHDEA